MVKRNTIQRTLVLEAVRELKNHAKADEVYDQVAKIHTTISRATVYRNLNLLVGEGVIAKVEMSDGADRFDHLTNKHYHAKCVHCGKILDVNMRYLDRLEEKVVDTEDFLFCEHDIIFKGVCKNCRQSLGKIGKTAVNNFLKED